MRTEPVQLVESEMLRPAIAVCGLQPDSGTLTIWQEIQCSEPFPQHEL